MRPPKKCGEYPYLATLFLIKTKLYQMHKINKLNQHMCLYIDKMKPVCSIYNATCNETIGTYIVLANQLAQW